MKSLLDILYPRVCYSCKIKISKGYLCNDCLSNLSINRGVEIYKKQISEHNDFYFDLAFAVYPMNNTIKNLIHGYKYSDLPVIGKFLGDFAVKFIKKENLFLDTNYIIPVPLHRVKKRIRGFNQSEILVKHIANHFDFIKINNLVIRKKFTRTQTELSRKEREQNVKDAFIYNKKYKIEHKNILIIDDVFTTGATVNSISKVLRKHNPNKIYVLTIARA